MVGLVIYPKRHLQKLVNKGDYAEAIEYAKSIESKFEDDYDFWFIVGGIYFILEDAKKAIYYFEKALSLKNDDVDTLTMKTNAHLFLEQKDDAIECCKRIIKIEPDNYEAHGLLEKLEDID
ncbi:MAG: tetratricopeptide repeat protein [Nitrosopumilaceae archaeon]|jgi:tetratricopeptide (TPR) repeat protein|uniref:Tetratricopeptide repeat protein n=3 Tax=Candidatus Nitrosomaritimum aestuariumsis TaxID=3342354 RepID=A0AC60W3W9_9ARCH|nr:tetratricopeptide repeat protein [Nitrosopumilaceae archaeon]MBA4454333.1 tetratricopeptide repeat protein [Nitrosopumilaceae archaeon]MBA4460358.1 tetratricopeptide repeat protein [Nitrosopumilaceae archaeon]MBA4461579.1 tetratricopeptide repeat protein [Nitrosopumilaceae archaeon]MBA4463143.1 tetratricopeptide repeat protein [Nitrosopumilaceae archaeon]